MFSENTWSLIKCFVMENVQWKYFTWNLIFGYFVMENVQWKYLKFDEIFCNEKCSVKILYWKIDRIFCNGECSVKILEVWWNIL